MYSDDLAFVHAQGFGGFIEGVMPAVLRRLGGPRRVVDVGCGDGRSTAALLAAGHAVVAIEPSPGMRRMAEARAPGAVILAGDAYATPLPPCDAILALGEPLAYHPAGVDAEGRLRAFFAAAAAALSPGGQLVFDLIETGPSLAGRSWRAAEDWAVLVEVVEEGPRLRRAILSFRREGGHWRRTDEVHEVHCFEAAAVRAWLAEAGFAVEDATAYGDHALLPRRRAFFARG